MGHNIERLSVGALVRERWHRLVETLLAFITAAAKAAVAASGLEATQDSKSDSLTRFRALEAPLRPASAIPFQGQKNGLHGKRPNGERSCVHVQARTAQRGRGAYGFRHNLQPM
jgi:hypothetical protein